MKLTCERKGWTSGPSGLMKHTLNGSIAKQAISVLSTVISGDPSGETIPSPMVSTKSLD